MCERVLNEKDGVFSAIRIIDIIFRSRRPDETEEFLPVSFTFLALGRLKPEAAGPHNVRLDLIRINGETETIGQSEVNIDPPKIAGIPAGFTVIVQMGFEPKNLGTAWVVMYFDGKEATRVPITIADNPNVHGETKKD